MTPLIARSSTLSRIQETLDKVAKDLLSPPKLGWLTTRFPQVINRLTTEKLINHAFAEQIADGDFDFLKNRILLVEILDASLYVGLSFNQNKIICKHFSDHLIDADATLSVDTNNAIALIQQEVDPDTLFFQRKLKINGDTELAHHVKNTIDTLDPEIIPSLLLKIVSEYKKRVLVD